MENTDNLDFAGFSLTVKDERLSDSMFPVSWANSTAITVHQWMMPPKELLPVLNAACGALDNSRDLLGNFQSRRVDVCRKNLDGCSRLVFLFQYERCLRYYDQNRFVSSFYAQRGHY
jgi:hypothetical protein